MGVVVRTTEELGKIKREFGVPADMQSCHTAMIDDYVTLNVLHTDSPEYQRFRERVLR